MFTYCRINAASALFPARSLQTRRFDLRFSHPKSLRKFPQTRALPSSDPQAKHVATQPTAVQDAATQRFGAIRA